MVEHNLEALRKIRDSTSNTKSREEIQEVIDLYEAFLGSEGHRIHLLSSDLHRSHYIVDRNYEELIESIEAYEEGSIDVTHENYEEVEQLALEFSRCLHNYVSSTKARYDLTRDVIDKLDSIDDSEPPIEDEYEDKNSDLDLVEYGYFFTGLRNYCIHDRPPIVKVSQEKSWTTTSEGRTSSEDRQLKLRKSDLLESGDYLSAPAREFLADREEEFHVRPEIESFNERLDELYEWLDDEIESRFESRLKEAQKLRENALDKQRKIFEDCK